MSSIIGAYNPAWLKWLAGTGAERLRGGSGFCMQFMAELTEPPRTEKRPPWADYLLAAVMREQSLPSALAFTAWETSLHDYLTGMLAVPLWRQGLGEAEDITELTLADRRPLSTPALADCLDKAGYGACWLPLFSDIDHLAAHGTVLAAASRAETQFPTFTVAAGQDGQGQLLSLTIEALRYESDRDMDLRGLFFPHIETAFMPVADDFTAAYQAASALWAEHWPSNVALRWTLSPATAFTANYLYGPSAGLAIAMAAGKALAGLTKDQTGIGAQG